MSYEKKTVHERRVLACIKEFLPKSFQEVVKVLEKFYGKHLELSVTFENCFKHINTVKNSYKEKYEARFNDYRRINVRKN